MAAKKRTEEKLYPEESLSRSEPDPRVTDDRFKNRLSLYEDTTPTNTELGLELDDFIWE